MTDVGGNVANVFAYDAYGTLIASNTAPQTVYLYCGEQFDPDLGGYYRRARYLNHNIGRFWTMDVSDYGNQEDPLSLHLYLYAHSNPIDNVDPSGHDIGAEMDVLSVSWMLDAMPMPTVSLAKKRVQTQVDVYIWDRALARHISYGHCLITEHNSQVVILSQFPFTQPVGGHEGITRLPPRGYNRTVTYPASFTYEKRNPAHRYVVTIPNSFSFYQTAFQQRAATYWDWRPTSADETQCAVASFLSLSAGGVPFGPGVRYSSGGLLPSTLNDWLMQDTRNSANGVTAVDPTTGK